MENYEHFITKNIRGYYSKRIWYPLFYMAALIICWFAFSMLAAIFPTQFGTDADPESFYAKENHYVKADLTDLTFTGYIAQTGGRTTGYYYYTDWNDSLLIVLLSPTTSEQGKPEIDQLTISAKLTEGNTNYSELLTRLAEDLEWTGEGIDAELPQVFLSEPAFHKTWTYWLYVFYFATLLFAFLNVLLYLLHIIVPKTAPACQNLVVYGHPLRMFDQAEEELATLPQLATEDMFITEHYFIMTGTNANAIVPINQIQWIYKHSVLHKFLWHTFAISYTMHITAHKHFYVHCPKNTKSDIDGIMDYLAEANHDILVGFSEENRQKIMAASSKPFHIEKIVAFFRKKI